MHSISTSNTSFPTSNIRSRRTIWKIAISEQKEHTNKEEGAIHLAFFTERRKMNFRITSKLAIRDAAMIKASELKIIVNSIAFIVSKLSFSQYKINF